MYYDDHPEPHFHATYGGREVKVRISDLSVMADGLNARANCPADRLRWLDRRLACCATGR
jgi:hypothetical protein